MKDTKETLDNDGVRVVYSRRGRPNGPPVVFLHGLMVVVGVFMIVAHLLRLRAPQTNTQAA